ncbi:hypothetical protein Poly51_04230 [Rubripirellula tenax]|uniref:Planctomycete cytochrome C n=1 Tax=Rubripirellula tenax TaxID=2528015 RepID=A0A5C6FJB9_9BACT|nr:DUF1592 domain-containing protein [Rubripirellula tenax]TWU60149.1 hypothetical protein Poly51_04230 [Rubripirellula tenax]
MRFAVLFVFVFTAIQATVAADDRELAVASKFFADHCADCHSAAVTEGGLDLSLVDDNFDDNFDDAQTLGTWVRIFDRVRTGEMPPADAGALDESEIAVFVDAVQPALTAASRRQSQTVMRRLNRAEYQNTMNDLFGTHLDLTGLLPEDGLSHEFDNVGEALGISPVHLQGYLAAVDAVLTAAIADTTSQPERTSIRVSYVETREGEKHIGEVWKQLDDGAVVFFQDFGYPTGMLRGTEVDVAGWYRLRVTGYAYQARRPITFRLGGTSFKPGSTKPTYTYASLPPIESTDGRPSTFEMRVWLEPGYMVEITPWGLTTNEYNIRKQGVRSYPGPGLAINHVEVEGPMIADWPGRGHELVFGGLDRREKEPSNPSAKTKKWNRPEFQIESATPTDDARRVLQRIATRAFRRPIDAPQLDSYVSLFEAEMAVGESVESSLRTAIAAIFCSTDFIYFSEKVGLLDDHALAARLSYFLTRTSPDDALRASADAGELTSDPNAIVRHARRLMADERHGRFISDFADAWLNLRDMEQTSPDQKLFPEYDMFLQDSAIKETRAFVDAMFSENLPVRHVVKSDIAFLNNRLAKHYQFGLGEMETIDTPELRRVRLPADSVRGGLMTQASVLKVSANGTNTSPIVRGVWVMHRILGQTPPPPPAGIVGVEPDIRGASTLRELLDKHRDSDTCRNCHAMIDPPGFALENFNPIGGYRVRFRSLGAGDRISKQVNNRKVQYRLGPPVDASGQLLDGRRFTDFVEFRDMIARDDDTLARSLITKLLTFATGREMGFADRSMIDDLVDRSRSGGHRVGDMILWVVSSDAMRRK